MKPIWTPGVFDKLGFTTAEEYAAWLKDGLLNWDDAQKQVRAFEPIQDRFEVAEPIEFQLGSMAKEMPLPLYRLLREGVERALKEVAQSDQYDLRAKLRMLELVTREPRHAPKLVKYHTTQ